MRADLSETGERHGDDAVLARLDAAEPYTPTFRYSVSFDAGTLPERPEEMIKGIPKEPGLLLFIGGQSGAGKSYVAVRVGVSACHGCDFYGLPVREKVGVIFVAAEGAGTIEARLAAAKKHLGIEDKLAFAIVKAVPNLSDDKQRAEFVAELKAVATFMVKSGLCRRVGMLIIDTLSAAFMVEDEDDNALAAIVCAQMREMGKELSSIVAPVHHYGKDKRGGLRGASNYRAWADIVISVLGDRNEATGEVRNRSLAIAKSRMGAEGPIGGFELKFILLGKDIYNEEYGDCVVIPSETDARTSAARGDRTFEDAFYEIALKASTHRHVNRNGPLVDAVRTASVRTEFMRRYGTGEGSKDASDASKQRAWRRIYAKEIKGNYGTESDDAGEWLWKL